MGEFTALPVLGARGPTPFAQVGAALEMLLGKPWVNVQDPDFGAVGDGVTNDRAAIQAAVDAGANIYFPNPTVSYFVDGSIQLANDKTLLGTSMWKGVRDGSTGNFVLVGNGTDPVLVAGTYPGDANLNRNIRTQGLSIRNNGAPCIQAYTAHNFTIRDCALRAYTLASTDSAALILRASPRPVIDRCSISASGGAWAISARDNCNGLSIVNGCILSGGSGGGAVDIGQSQSVTVDGSVIETSGTGIRVAATSTNGGNCSGVVLSNNYIEVCNKPISLGAGFTVRGGEIRNNYISNASASAATWHLQLGRCIGIAVEGNTITRITGGTEPTVEFVYNASVPSWFSWGSIKHNRVVNGTGAWYALSGFPNAGYLNRIVSFNEVQVPPVGDTSISGVTSGQRIWESGTITANVGHVTRGIVAGSIYGGWVDFVEVIEATGTLGCTVDIGSTTGITDIDSFDPSSLTLVQGTVRRVPTQPYWRVSEPMRVRVTAGAGTGSFRLRIIYRTLEA